MNRKTFLKGGFVGAVIAFSAIAVMGMGDPGMSPWVRLIQSWPGTQESGHINVDGNVGANGIVIQDNAPNDGYLEFPGEPKIHSRAELIGPKGDKGDTGAPGGGGGIKDRYRFSDTTLMFLGGFESYQSFPVTPAFPVTIGDTLNISIRRDVGNTVIDANNFQVNLSLRFELQAQQLSNGEWITIETLAVRNFQDEDMIINPDIPDIAMVELVGSNWSPTIWTELGAIADYSGLLRIIMIAESPNSTSYVEAAQGSNDLTMITDIVIM